MRGRMKHKPQPKTEPSMHWNQRSAVKEATARPWSSPVYKRTAQYSTLQSYHILQHIHLIRAWFHCLEDGVPQGVFIALHIWEIVDDLARSRAAEIMMISTSIRQSPPFPEEAIDLRSHNTVHSRRHPASTHLAPANYAAGQPLLFVFLYLLIHCLAATSHTPPVNSDAPYPR